MAKAKIKWDIGGFEDVRKREDVQTAVNEIARKIASACGPGYVHASSTGKTRARASVIAATPAAMQDNRRNNTILNNLSAGKS